MNLLTPLLCGAAAFGCLTVFPEGSRPLPPQQGEPDLQITGTVEELWASSPGHVQLRVNGTDQDGKVRMLWFETPADKDINTLFENLALGVVRQALDSKLQLTVQAKKSSGDDGSVATKAYDIVRLGIHPGS